jgi:hypothetical protein
MIKKKQTRFVHVGNYAAAVEVALIITDEEWSPYLSLDDAYKLDDVRRALQEENLAVASQLAQVYELAPVAV